MCHAVWLNGVSEDLETWIKENKAESIKMSLAFGKETCNLTNDRVARIVYDGTTVSMIEIRGIK